MSRNWKDFFDGAETVCDNFAEWLSVGLNGDQALTQVRLEVERAKMASQRLEAV